MNGIDNILCKTDLNLTQRLTYNTFVGFECDGEKLDQIIWERNIFKCAFHLQFEYTTFIHKAEILDGMRV